MPNNTLGKHKQNLKNHQYLLKKLGLVILGFNYI
jgi:hypothetical protein